MYLVPAEEYHPHTKRGRPPRRRRTKQHHNSEWIKLRTKHREAELRRNARTKEIADYMKQILPYLELPTLKAKSRLGTQTDVTSASVTYIRPSTEIIYESDDKAWLEYQDAYTMHRPARRRFYRNPYTVTNIMEVWEFDILDMQFLSKYNDTNRYSLSVIDVFSNYLHLVPIKTKSGPAVTSAFRSLIHDDSPRNLWVLNNKGKEFLNKHFQDILRDEGIQFQVCRNPHVKFAVVESVHRTIRDRSFKFFTFSNSYRYIDVLQKFVKAYNDTVHTTTGMAPSRVTDADVLTIWRRMEPRDCGFESRQPSFVSGSKYVSAKRK